MGSRGEERGVVEVPEQGAPPEIARVYAELREATGVPVVNQVLRRMAALPGVLDWTWAAVREPLVTGRLNAAREHLAEASRVELTPIGEADWAAAGVAKDERDAVRALVAGYNRGNLTNVLLLTALTAVLDGSVPNRMPTHAPTAAGRPAALPEPPPIPSLASLPPATADAVGALARRHGSTGVIPNLYLHLALWPALPGCLPGWLDSALHPDQVRAGALDTLALVTPLASELGLTDPGPVPNDQHAVVVELLQPFTGTLIPSMVPVGLALAARLGAHPSH